MLDEVLQKQLRLLARAERSATGASPATSDSLRMDGEGTRGSSAAGDSSATGAGARCTHAAAHAAASAMPNGSVDGSQSARTWLAAIEPSEPCEHAARTANINGGSAGRSLRRLVEAETIAVSDFDGNAAMLIPPELLLFDIELALERLGGNEELMRRLLKQFVSTEQLCISNCVKMAKADKLDKLRHQANLPCPSLSQDFRLPPPAAPTTLITHTAPPRNPHPTPFTRLAPSLHPLTPLCTS